jgi:hypothetical protein
MGRRGRLDKFRAPAPEPTPEPAAQGSQPADGQKLAAAPEEKPFESERLMLFGPPRTQKNIAVISVTGLVLMGLIYVVLAKDEKPFPVGALIFAAIHGGLLGMLMGQLILVYADRMIVLFTLMAVVVAESIYGATHWAGLETINHRQLFQEVLGIFFWAGFVGFWLGFIFFVKRLRDRARFQRRFTA